MSDKPKVDLEAVRAKVNLLHVYPEDPIRAIAEAARVSRRSSAGEEEEEDHAELVHKLREWGHWSPFEFAAATFLIEGISRNCSHQLVRHRHLSFLQESQRYTTPTDAVIPPSFFSLESDLLGEVNDLIRGAFDLYDRLVRAGIPREDARFVLPQATATRLRVKGNFRAWREVIARRLGEPSQWEIKAVMREILRQLYEAAPVAFEDLWAEFAQPEEIE